MKNSISLILLVLIFLITACSKTAGKTQAKMKLNLSGIVSNSSLSTSIGSGGTLFFGRSATGESFGKVVLGTEDTLIIPNGDWAFYAVMWDTATTGKPMNDKVFCGKSVAKLSGTDVQLNINLGNSTCSDAEFSGGKYYTSAGLVRFADFFVEECDDINATTTWYCGADNQGSSLSYRLKFQNFKRAPGALAAFDGDVLVSACNKIDKLDTTDILHKGLEVNFPSGNGNAPFVATLELFLGSASCDTTESKGVHSIVLQNGLGAPAPTLSKVIASNTDCTFNTPDYPADMTEKRNLCDAYIGNWNASNCDTVLPFITRFAPTCSSQTAANYAIKQMVAIPKNVLCDRYNNLSSNIGSHPFAGGNGAVERPYKICNEWQMNQIGEVASPDTYRTSSYKLMNDLDMNKTDMGPYAKPSCVTANSTNVEQHYNLNPFPKLESTCGTINDLNSTNGFQGVFNGNYKTIANARISTEGTTSDYVGFIRKLHGGAIVKNLVFKNLEVRGHSKVGGVVGFADAGGALISNIKIKGLNVEGKSNGGVGGDYIGGIVGSMSSAAKVENTVVSDAEVRGRDTMGGIAGVTMGTLTQVGFSGTVDHYDSSGSTIGGLVGNCSSGCSINKSFSEGVMNTGAAYAGGLIGQTSSASIVSSYSTMVINSRYSGAGVFIGGISGNMGSVTDVFYDGVINHNGGSTPNLAGISTNLSGYTNCYSTYSPAGGSCSSLTASELRSGASSFSDETVWVKTSGSIPRLVWEQRECALANNQLPIPSQVAPLGRGGALNPIIICNSSQLKSIEGRSSSEYYRLADDINLSQWLVQSDLIGTFNGVLIGDKHILYGANATVAVNTTAEYVGLIGVNTGTIRGVKIADNKIMTTSEELASGILVGKNDGTITGVELMSNELTGFDNLGAIAGKNSDLGKINLVDVSDGFVKGDVSVGGAVGFNMANISGAVNLSRVSVRTKIQNNTSTFQTFGGIVGTNLGKLDQAQYSGEISTSVSTGTPPLMLGGIAGSNSGVITNTFTKGDAQIRVKDTNQIGGLVGLNNSGALIAKSFNLGRLVYDNAGASATSSQPFHPIYGTNNGNIASDVYFVENNIGSLKQSGTTSSPMVGNGADTGFISPTPIGDLFSSSYTSGGDDIKTMIPMTLNGQYIRYTSTETFSSGSSFNFYQSYVLSDVSAQKTIVNMKDVTTYCPGGFSGSAGQESCVSGFDIVYTDKTTPANNKGYDRLINYYVSIMNGQVPPANTPVWEFESSNGGPRLLQLLNH